MARALVGGLAEIGALVLFVGMIGLWSAIATGGI